MTLHNVCWQLIQCSALTRTVQYYSSFSFVSSVCRMSTSLLWCYHKCELMNGYRLSVGGVTFRNDGLFIEKEEIRGKAGKGNADLHVFQIMSKLRKHKLDKLLQMLRCESLLWVFLPAAWDKVTLWHVHTPAIVYPTWPGCLQAVISSRVEP